MNIVSTMFFLGILIAIVLAIYGYFPVEIIVLAIYGHFLVKIYEKLYDFHRNSIMIEHLQNDMQCVVNRCKDLSHTVEDLEKKRR